MQEINMSEVEVELKARQLGFTVDRFAPITSILGDCRNAHYAMPFKPYMVLSYSRTCDCEDCQDARKLPAVYILKRM